MGCEDQGVTFRLILDVLVVSSVLLVNIFILAVVVWNWRRRGLPYDKETTTLLLLNLSVAEILVAVFSVLYLLPGYLCAVAEYLGHHFVPCMLRYVLVLTAECGSGFTLIALCVDRYIAAHHAMRYAQLLDATRGVSIVALTWVSAICCSSLLFVWNSWTDGNSCNITEAVPLSYSVFVDVVLHLTVICTMLIISWYIHLPRLKFGGVVEDRTEQSSSRKIINKCVRTILISVIVYTLSWFSFMVASYISYTGYKVSNEVLDITFTLTKVNHAVNPFVFAYSRQHIKTYMSSTWKYFKTKLLMIILFKH